MLRVGIDLDGVVFDFDGRMLQEFSKRGICFSSTQEMQETIPKHNNLILLHRTIRAERGFFRNLDLLPGALEHVIQLKQNYDIYFVSTPELTNPSCCDDKLHNIVSAFTPVLGEDGVKSLLQKTILTHDKTLVRVDVLIDDKPLITGCLKPSFIHIHFTSWSEQVLKAVAQCSPQ
ncbi:5'-3'-deoxyribonucleotidase [Cedratvirus Zaza IHUMI]|uniref:5'-3'-deoxyribonucleotidase n=1 Tax=Cedratvirus Zaza IHUMI TaxID=2126979 RepID=A0A2R8FD87_9VIRU|nr:5'-3'-deoxyribonucleotidase [Cedratvirus Zaza IHUMI]